jgi:hypothetical protein
LKSEHKSTLGILLIQFSCLSQKMVEFLPIKIGFPSTAPAKFCPVQETELLALSLLARVLSLSSNHFLLRSYRTRYISTRVWLERVSRPPCLWWRDFLSTFSQRPICRSTTSKILELPSTQEQMIYSLLLSPFLSVHIGASLLLLHTCPASTTPT